MNAKPMTADVVEPNAELREREPFRVVFALLALLLGAIAAAAPERGDEAASAAVVAADVAAKG